MSNTAGIFLLFFFSLFLYIYIYIYIGFSFYLRLLMTLSLTAGAHDVLPRNLFSLVFRATVQHGPSPTQLTHLRLTALWRSLRHGTALLSLVLCVFTSQRYTLNPLSLSLPQLSYSWSPKKGLEMPKKRCSYFISQGVWWFCFVSSACNSHTKPYHIRSLILTCFGICSVLSYHRP